MRRPGHYRDLGDTWFGGDFGDFGRGFALPSQPASGWCSPEGRAALKAKGWKIRDIPGGRIVIQKKRRRKKSKRTVTCGIRPPAETARLAQVEAWRAAELHRRATYKAARAKAKAARKAHPGPPPSRRPQATPPRVVLARPRQKSKSTQYPRP